MKHQESGLIAGINWAIEQDNDPDISNNPLTYVLRNAKLDATGHRWVAQLANYNFTVSYGPGSSNHVADALSRIKWPEITSHVVSQLLQVHVDEGSGEWVNCWHQLGH